MQNEILNNPEGKNHIGNLLETLYKLEKLFNPLVSLPEGYILEENDIEELAKEFFQNKDSSNTLVRPTFYSGY